MFLPFIALLQSFFSSAESNGVLNFHEGVAGEAFAVSAVSNALFFDTFFDFASACWQGIFAGESVTAVAGLAEFFATACGTNDTAGRFNGFKNSAFTGLEILVGTSLYVVNGLTKLCESYLVLGHGKIEDSTVVQIFCVIENFVAVGLKFFNGEVEKKLVICFNCQNSVGFENSSVFFQKSAAGQAAFRVSSLWPWVGKV